jgi:hypothetical protein
MLDNHPGLIQPSIISPVLIKVLWLLCLAGGMAGVAAMFIVQPEPPPFLE